MSLITTGNLPKAHWPGVKKFYGTEYNRYEPIWTKMFEVQTSDKGYEEMVETVGFGLMSQKPQGTSITYDSTNQGTVSRFTHITYGIGFMVTMEELQDNLYEELSWKRSGKLARSVAETQEVIHANVFNNAFSGSYLGGDGASLCSTSHACGYGTQSNRLAVDADLSEAAIEDMLILAADAKDARGLRFRNMARTLLVPKELQFEAYRILNSVQQNDTANNAVNAIKAMGMFPEGVVVNPYFTDIDAWFIRTNCPDGLIHFWRMQPTFDQDNDFDTKNFKAATVARWSQSWANWRQIYGTQGA
jgi:hypothetical protein